jgi:hypothetical protein
MRLKRKMMTHAAENAQIPRNGIVTGITGFGASTHVKLTCHWTLFAVACTKDPRTSFADGSLSHRAATFFVIVLQVAGILRSVSRRSQNGKLLLFRNSSQELEATSFTNLELMACLATPLIVIP